MIFRRMNSWPTWHFGDQWDQTDRLRRALNTLTESLSGRDFGEPSAGVFPLMNVTEDTNHFYIRAELPGITANELNISVTGDSFSIFRREENAPRAGEFEIPPKRTGIRQVQQNHEFTVAGRHQQG